MFCVACMILAHDVAVNFAGALLCISKSNKMTGVTGKTSKSLMNTNEKQQAHHENKGSLDVNVKVHLSHSSRHKLEPLLKGGNLCHSSGDILLHSSKRKLVPLQQLSNMAQPQPYTLLQLKLPRLPTPDLPSDIRSCS